MTAKANNLFHFTKSIEVVKSILLNGFLPKYCLEDARYFGLEFLAYPMTCFCDIPISRLEEHTSFYGEYGLGLTKEWGLRNSLTPIIYTGSSGAIPDLIKYLLNLDMKDANGNITEEQGDLNSHFKKLLPLIKPLSGNMVVGGTIIEKDFYQENEWRYVPDKYPLLFHDKFDAEKENLNKEIEPKKITFLPSDVRYIFVKTDAEIPVMFDFIQNSLGNYPLNEIKILYSRIVSLETISRDI